MRRGHCKGDPEWARSAGEGTDYTDNVPIQRFNPPGHFYEVPNMKQGNGVLALDAPAPEPPLADGGQHRHPRGGRRPGGARPGDRQRATLAFEASRGGPRTRGGGLPAAGSAFLEGLAQPREDTEFHLRYYNTLTTWVDVDKLLKVFNLSRQDLSGDPAKVAAAVRSMAARVPTYVTIKDVKRRWGHGQEDVFPVAQFEKLWGDLTSLPDLPCSFLAVDRRRGQQLKDTAQLDGWANDGSREYVLSLCEFGG
ncbi:MAG: hypothetical protein U0835_10415 [Isosphaeraceae bacterium]